MICPYRKTTKIENFSGGVCKSEYFGFCAKEECPFYYQSGLLGFDTEATDACRKVDAENRQDYRLPVKENNNWGALTMIMIATLIISAIGLVFKIVNLLHTLY